MQIKLNIQVDFDNNFDVEHKYKIKSSHAFRISQTWNH
jgi:hypothetical protein